MKHKIKSLILGLSLFVWVSGNAYAAQTEEPDAGNSDNTAAVVDQSRALSAAEKAQSQFYRGMTSYLEGDYQTAAKSFHQAAGQGHANAQFTLGVMFYQGDGVDQDYKEAVKWYRLAADQGLAPAQFNVGMMYYQGDGVDQDYQEAAKWYRMVAEQGLAQAQFNLGMMYNLGQGVKQDQVHAYMWADLAAANDHPKAIELRNTVAQALAPADIAKAQQLAKECQENSYKGC